ncbi:hypothetical protein CFP65_5987 [Kitasatospora sp. MMS16-BH015]|uniref:hypothetical protein n=1 Tax=Kitasatospora sp. MMS16-BH015 TaxID=2018025 RepID=UPI000CA1BA17|nr:hypothetical protein [Kitasatospora sp. MMS16-BH015]AUG80661.1 hypothetical protein CFP65_5987 [Kitasatospora sp. MMS16-BH015]
MNPDLSLPPVAAPYQLPFHYGALHQIGLDYLTDPGPARKLLAERHPALTLAEFDGRACLTLNYQLYFAQYAGGGGVTQEIEVSLVAYPTAQADRLAGLSYRQYAHGLDQTKLLGIARLHVLCDNPIAIEAGTKLFGEPKYPAAFEVTMPSLNGPAGETWAIRCATPEGAPLLSFTAALDGLPHTPVNSAPVTGYGTDQIGRALAGPMNVYHPYRYVELDEDTTGRVGLSVHDPASEVGADLTELLGSAPAVAAWSYQSAPVGAHNHPYYLRG